MAEYCSKCKVLPFTDLNLFFIGLKLPKGKTQRFICEGCNIRGLKRDKMGKLFIIRQVEGNEIVERTFQILLAF